MTIDDIDRIIDIQIALIQKRLQERKMSLELTENAKKYIAKTGYSPVYGARPLKRALQKMILDDLSMEILEGNSPKETTSLVDAKEWRHIISEKR